MRAYYNEHDKFAAAWLRELIKHGHLAEGDVDERDIQDVLPSELRGYTQCHFFAGIGVWSRALRLAMWPDDRAVWTGSCPCQPFSQAGERAGFDDERHLWPAWHHLIQECRPATLFGEQVSKADGRAWLSIVRHDLETSGYAVGAADLSAAGVGAPHKRERHFFVANADGGHARTERQQRSRQHGLLAQGGRSGVALGDTSRTGLEVVSEQPARRERTAIERTGEAGALAHDRFEGRRQVGAHLGGRGEGSGTQRLDERLVRSGAWSDADWLWCRDEKWRPVEPITLKMVDGSAASLGRLRPESISEIHAEVMKHVNFCEGCAREAMHDVWCSLRAQEVQHPTRRFRSVYEASLLLAFLRQLADQGWVVAQSVSRSGEEAKAAQMRGVRCLRKPYATACTSCGRRLDQQLATEHSNLVRVLSSVLARHAQASWGEIFDANAAVTAPLAHKSINRVGRLRGYGNAIIGQLAAEFIASYREAQGEEVGPLAHMTLQEMLS